jgi:hypothetical protein
MLSRILDSVLSIQRDVLSIQWDATYMSVRIERNHINIRHCLKKLEPKDDEDDLVLWSLMKNKIDF